MQVRQLELQVVYPFEKIVVSLCHPELVEGCRRRFISTISFDIPIAIGTA